MSILGWYYLHTNGSLIYKPSPDAAADIRESPFAVALWPCDPTDRAGAWQILVEAKAAGANAERVTELATKWGGTDEDAQIYAGLVGAVLTRDGNQWCAKRKDFINLQESASGFGDTALDALAALCKDLGYKPAKIWGNSFPKLLELQAVPA